MSSKEPVVWQAKPHTKAKHEILSGYLGVWAKILTNFMASYNKPRTIRFIDAFAGPGVFRLGNSVHPGSPIRALQALAAYPAMARPVNLHFIEKCPLRHARLVEELAKAKPQGGWPEHVITHPPQLGDCNDVLSSMMEGHDPRVRPLGPALVFLDQFGYGSVPMSLVRNILAHPQCEVLTFLDASHLNRFLQDQPKDAARTQAFGGEEWREALTQPAGHRALLLRKIYRNNMKRYGGAGLVWDFAMLDEAGVPICWLFFGTTHKSGLKEMKKAMRRVDSTFAYADSDSLDQVKLFSNCDADWLRDRLADHFADQSVTVEEIEMYVLEHTPLVNYGAVLKQMLKKRQIKDLGDGPISYTKPEHAHRRVQFNQRGLGF